MGIPNPLYLVGLKRAPKILYVGHPTLRLRALEASAHDLTSPKFRGAVEDIKRVFASPLHPVVGLAAPQVGYSIRLLAYQILDSKHSREKNVPSPVPLTFLVNPVIKSLESESKWTSDIESCESVPNYHCVVKRPSKLAVTAWDLEGKDISFEVQGYLARIIHHEVDHLNGLTMLDRCERGSLCHDSYIGKFSLKR
ncbi:RNAPII degradation factor [Chytridiales sp. JEL 0842]|nr:RNAPII degradation factor [Chytridiales sp. JEL 0842]